MEVSAAGGNGRGIAQHRCSLGWVPFADLGDEMVDFAVVPERTALVNVDLQNWFVDMTPEGVALVERVNELAEACREAGILVVHTSHVLRSDGSNIGVVGEIVPEVKRACSTEGHILPLSTRNWCWTRVMSS